MGSGGGAGAGSELTSCRTQGIGSPCQIASNSVLKTNTISPDSGGQMSKMHLAPTGLKSRRLQDCVPSAGLRGRPHLLQLLDSAHIPGPAGFWPLFSISLITSSCLPPPFPKNDPVRTLGPPEYPGCCPPPTSPLKAASEGFHSHLEGA